MIRPFTTHRSPQNNQTQIEKNFIRQTILPNKTVNDYGIDAQPKQTKTEKYSDDKFLPRFSTESNDCSVVSSLEDRFKSSQTFKESQVLRPKVSNLLTSQNEQEAGNYQLTKAVKPLLQSRTRTKALGRKNSFKFLRSTIQISQPTEQRNSTFSGNEEPLYSSIKLKQNQINKKTEQIARIKALSTGVQSQSKNLPLLKRNRRASIETHQVPIFEDIENENIEETDEKKPSFLKSVRDPHQLTPRLMKNQSEHRGSFKKSHALQTCKSVIVDCQKAKNQFSFTNNEESLSQTAKTNRKFEQTPQNRLCINCQNFIPKQSIASHEKQCLGFQIILQMSNDEFLDFLNEKIESKLIQLQDLRQQKASQTLQKNKRNVLSQEVNKTDKVITELDRIRLNAMKKFDLKKMKRNSEIRYISYRDSLVDSLDIEPFVAI